MTRKTLLAAGALMALVLPGADSFARVKSAGRKRAIRSSSSLNAFSPGIPFSPGRSNLLSNSSASSQVPQDEPLYNNRYSAGDWLHNVFTLPRSSVLRDIRNPVVTIAVWGTIVSLMHRMLARTTSPTLLKFASDMCIGAAPHSFLVSALGLLLVFRTNSAYQRFNEGRKIWENILSTSRNISRMVNLYGKDVGKDRKSRIISMVAAFPYLLRHHVRPGCLCEHGDRIPEDDRLSLNRYSTAVVDTRYEGDRTTRGKQVEQLSDCWVNKRHYPWRLFEEGALRKVTHAKNRPLWVCDRVGREIMSIPYGPNFTSRERLSLLSSVEKLTNTVGQCERIHQTAVPLNYARHSLRSLTLWLVTLPFALVSDMGLLTGPVMAVISWLLFGVYQIGYSIEDPFQGSLRLSILSDAIRRDVIGETDSRNTAFSLDDWDDDDSLQDLDEIADSIGKSVVEQTRKVKKKDVVKSFVADSNQANVILNQPSLIKENGTWNVVGIVEG